MPLSLSVTGTNGAVAEYHVVEVGVIDEINKEITLTIGHFADLAHFQTGAANSLWVDSVVIPISPASVIATNAESIVSLAEEYLASTGPLSGAAQVS